MEYLPRTKRIAIAAMVVIGVCVICYFAISEVAENFNFSKATSEEVFHRHLLEYRSPVPPGVEEIQGIEGVMFGYQGPAYIRFRATDEFIDSIIEKGYVDPFLEIPCSDFIGTASKYFVKNYPEKFDWWRPAEVTSPVCYRAQGGQFDDAKYLLVSSEDKTAYFYRTPTCGLCPD